MFQLLADLPFFSKEKSQSDNPIVPLFDNEVANLKKLEDNLKSHYPAYTSNSVLEAPGLIKSLKHVDVMTANQRMQKMKGIELPGTFNEAIFNG